eukprot:CCRYP_015398-RA/>CCRYP_015398-RA protein AED:0.03 eAED:0.03 QI:132/1/1/1/1/1/4/605/773
MTATVSRHCAALLLSGLFVTSSRAFDAYLARSQCLSMHEYAGAVRLRRRHGWEGTRRGSGAFLMAPPIRKTDRLLRKSAQLDSRHCGSSPFSSCRLSTSEAATDSNDALEEMESVVVDEVLKSFDADYLSSPPSNANSERNNRLLLGKSFEDDSQVGNPSQVLSALKRAVEIGNILGSQLMMPILSNLSKNKWPTEESGGWENFWATSSSYNSDGARIHITNAQRLALALEELGPTYVKFGQALGSRPDVVPPSLANALSALQDDMKPFDGENARQIVWRELNNRVIREDTITAVSTAGEESSSDNITMQELMHLMSNLTDAPIAAASIGQVYKAHIPGKGDVAVKVQRPGVRRLVESDTELLLTIARFVESLPALPSTNEGNSKGSKKSDQRRLINTRLVSATQEFMSRIFEELDYRNEARNCLLFSSLYSRYGSISSDVRVVVPKVYMEWCTENVLTMEWIDGTKLTDVQTSGKSEDSVKENLELVKLAIDSTLNQLLVTGVLHADPHAGNLLKVLPDDGSVALGYLDFGLLSTIPSQVRDALVCSVVLQVFSRDVDAVSSLFGELQLIPHHVLADSEERKALSKALEITFENSLLYPESSCARGDITAIPELKFDKLLDSLSRLVPRFQFDLPPYFINNARALSTLEGIAKSLDPSFNVLTVMYPYAITMLLQNPSGSPVVSSTLQSLVRSKDGRINRDKISRLLRDSALISRQSKLHVAWDVIKAKEGRELAAEFISEELKSMFRGACRDNGGDLLEKRRKRRWFYLQL